MKVGCYSLDLYCDTESTGGDQGWHHSKDYQPMNFTGRTLAACLRQANTLGWSCTGKRDLCPKCNPKRRLKSEA